MHVYEEKDRKGNVPLEFEHTVLGPDVGTS